MRYKAEHLTARLPNGYVVSVMTTFPGTFGARHFALDSECHLEIHVPTPLDFDQLGRFVVTRFSNLITYAVGIPSALKTLTIATDAGEMYEVEAQWVFVRRGETPNRLDVQMLLPGTAINFETLISRWFHLYEDCERALNTYFGLIYAPPTYTELQFITAVTAAEALHSGLQLAAPTDRETLKNRKTQIIDAIASAISEQDLSWVESLLRSAGGPTLKTRLRELWMYAEESARYLIANRDVWVNAVANERHNLSHPGRARLEPLQLFLARESVARIVTLCVLRALTEDPEYGAARVMGLSEWQHFAGQIREHIPEWLNQETPG